MSAAPARQPPFWYHRALCPEGTSEVWFEELFRAIDRSLPFERDLRFVPASQWDACRARSTRAKQTNDFVREFPVYYAECSDELRARWTVRHYLADLCLDKLLDIEEDAVSTANAAYQAGQRAYEERKAWVAEMQKREKDSAGSEVAACLDDYANGRRGAIEADTDSDDDDEEEEEEEKEDEELDEMLEDETAESEDDEAIDKELEELRAKLKQAQAELQQVKAEERGAKRKLEDMEMRLAVAQAVVRHRPASV